MIGGGTILRPGEVSLSYNGVLFLDELSEFRKNVLEVMCQPFEGKWMTFSVTTVPSCAGDYQVNSNHSKEEGRGWRAEICHEALFLSSLRPRVALSMWDFVCEKL
jgi:hypothetical protein